MPGTSKHIIRRQIVDFCYNGKADGFALQKEVSDWCKFMLIPEIEQQLAFFDFDDERYITIDRLEIDAAIDKKDWQQKIRNELISSLNYKLQDYKPVVKKIADKQKTENRSQKLDELILFYFEKGYLPWWSKAFVENNFDEVLLNWIMEEKSQARAEAIVFKLQQINRQPVITRIVNQVPGRLFFKFAQHIFKNEVETLSEVATFFNQMLRVDAITAKGKKVPVAFYKFLLAMLIKSNGKTDVESVLLFFKAIIKNENALEKIALKALPDKISLSANRFAKEWQHALSEEIKNYNGKNIAAVKKESKSQHQLVPDRITNIAIEEESIKNIAEDLREGFYIENAGAVIIAAFLPILFERLKITVKAELVKPELGVLMIQYIVSGKVKVTEHELLLPKILCGISVELPVNTNKKISKSQQAEADEMLRSAIEYWTVIKSTTVDGLRESFLKRSGKLTLVDDEWLLQVEQKSYDMLLQQLPWNISMIKLPWMKNLLKTEWV
jgi:Contractile injection system tape measure protein